MDYIIIDVPDMNDSVSRVVLKGKQYQIRFTWSDTGGYWYFGVTDALGSPILIGVKVVPRFPLNLFCGIADLPFGVFGVFTEQEHIGRYDFLNGKARFAFVPVD